ncbi:type 1 glutamine amidotransferase [Haloferula sp. A504]|uniref:type 1 glutamine amidotransferase n=1 Tax=Haloferula sp. A504 TaxID=3373601 RepID=UPI0031C047EE|nr:type 1 glutamine amidotransferase [Verrucomicrobiaceae bacterium E54]
MHAHYFQHVPFEGLGAIEPWLREHGFGITRTAFFEGESPPAPEGIDFLIIMGGPMSVNDEATHPWLVGEKAFIRTFLDTGKPVLGICLGAQLIASALGARVYPNSEPEIGWFPLEGVSSTDGFHFPTSFTAFHWHGETFDLPKGAIPLARTEACENQAFRLGDRVIGLQFHLETTPESAAALVANCADELVDAPRVQTADEILSPEACGAANELLNQVLSSLVDPCE